MWRGNGFDWQWQAELSKAALACTARAIEVRWNQTKARDAA